MRALVVVVVLAFLCVDGSLASVQTANTIAEHADTSQSLVGLEAGSTVTGIVVGLLLLVLAVGLVAVVVGRTKRSKKAEPGTDQSQWEKPELKPLEAAPATTPALVHHHDPPVVALPRLLVVHVVPEGTLVRVYSHSNTCPASGPRAMCSEVVVGPRAASVPDVRSHVRVVQQVVEKKGGAEAFAGFMAFGTDATRLNRPNFNTTLWTGMREALAGVGLRAVDEGSFAPGTLPGTMQAWLQYLATKQGKGLDGNFVAMQGGAQGTGGSVQVGFRLSSSTAVRAWRKYVLLRAGEVPPCATQKHQSDFVATVVEAHSQFEPLHKDDVLRMCEKTLDCVGLVSLIASGGQGRPSSPTCPTKDGFHTVGGFGESEPLFDAFLHELKEAKGTSAGEACHVQGEGNCDRCLLLMSYFARQDPQIQSVRLFLKNSGLVNRFSTLQWWKLGDMRRMDYTMDSCLGWDDATNAQSSCVCDDTAEMSAHVRFGLWARAVVGALGLPDNKLVAQFHEERDWVDVAAATYGFTDQCDVGLPAPAGEHTCKVNAP